MAEFVLTLIAAPAASGQLEAATDAAALALRERGARVGRPDVLAPAVACDLPFDLLAPREAAAAARGAVGGLPIDCLAQRAAGRRKRLLVADLEATIIANEMLEEIASFVGLRAPVERITWRAMNGEIDFAAALRQRVALLKGMKASVLDEAGARIRITPGARALVATMRANGARCALVTGGFGIYARRVRDQLGFDYEIANEIEIEDGRLTGAVKEPIRGGDEKLATLLRLAGEQGIALGDTLAVGDGANDLAMIDAAGLGVAYRGKPSVAALASARVDHTDLAALLYAQGYRREEIVGRDQL
ncbi:MAG TPA: phosphoserine phosphatase SerB [Stellaceae bacterium]|nr:phosphoserine phosphatase SerB [Stellaceae bacterium]